MMEPEPPDLQTSYDLVAEEYSRQIFEELAEKPFDCQVLDQFASKVQSLGLVCDLGCGPGQVARHLRGRGVQVLGVDLSPGMVAQARRLNPEIDFRVGDMRSLGVEDGAWVGIVAFYSLIHIPRSEIVAVLTEWNRVLRPGGSLLVAFHLGDEIIHRDEWWGRTVSIDFIFFHADEMIGFMEAAGFEVVEVLEREPYSEVEYPSRRVYLTANKPEESRESTGH